MFPTPLGCPLSPLGVPIPMSPVTSRCPYPCYYVPCLHRMSPSPCSLSPQSVPISLGCPHSMSLVRSKMSPSPRGVPISMAPLLPACFLFTWCVPCPLLPRHVCCPMLSPTPQDVPIHQGFSLGYPLVPWLSLSPGPLSPWGDPLSLWRVPIFPKVFLFPIPRP